VRRPETARRASAHGVSCLWFGGSLFQMMGPACVLYIVACFMGQIWNLRIACFFGTEGVFVIYIPNVWLKSCAMAGDGEASECTWGVLLVIWWVPFLDDGSRLCAIYRRCGVARKQNILSGALMMVRTGWKLIHTVWCFYVNRKNVRSLVLSGDFHHG